MYITSYLSVFENNFLKVKFSLLEWVFHQQSRSVISKIGSLPKSAKLLAAIKTGTTMYIAINQQILIGIGKSLSSPALIDILYIRILCHDDH